MKFTTSILACFIAIFLAACNPPSVLLTQENLDRVQEGMTSSQVKAILGSPTASKEEPIPIVGGTKTTYSYSNKDGGTVTIILKNDTVQTKQGTFPPRN